MCNIIFKIKSMILNLNCMAYDVLFFLFLFYLTAKNSPQLKIIEKGYVMDREKRLACKIYFKHNLSSNVGM